MLLEAGYAVTAIEPSDDLLSYARAAAPEATFFQGSIYDVAIPTCDAILATGEPLTYHEHSNPESRLRDFFHRAAAALPPGGLLIFDLIETGAPSLNARR